MKVLVCIVLFTVCTFAQERITNGTVLEMVAGSIPESVVITKIKTSKADFDVSPAALSDLVKQKVPESVISAMLERQATQNDADTVSDKLVITMESPENGEIGELSEAKKVYFYTDDARSREILVRDLKKYPLFESVDAVEKADFVIVFKIVGWEYNTVFFGTMNNKAITGDFYAVKLGNKDREGRTRVRILYSTRKTKNVPADAHPAKSTLQKFFKDLNKLQAKR